MITTQFILLSLTVLFIVNLALSFNGKATLNWVAVALTALVGELALSTLVAMVVISFLSSGVLA